MYDLLLDCSVHAVQPHLVFSILSILLRGKPFVFFENLGEIALRRVIKVIGDLTQRTVSMAKQISGFLQFFAVDIFGNAHTHFCFETYGQTASAQTAVIGKDIQTDGLMEMDRDIPEAGFNDFG